MTEVVDIQHKSTTTKMSVGSFISSTVASFFEYDTPKIVHIKSKKVGLINRLLQLAIIGYIIGWVLVYKKGYQSTDDVMSAVTTKMKGVAYTNITDEPNLNVKDTTPYNRIWDVSDYVIPPQQTNAFFVMTNMIITPGQSKGECPEDPKIPNAECSGPEDCDADMPITNGNGVMTGKCVNYTYPDGNVTQTCEIKAWCPVEFDKTPVTNKSVLSDAANFTVLIKNSIQFPKFKVSKRNILEDSNSTYLKQCHYSSRTDQFCPVFTLGTIAKEIGGDFNSLAYLGAVVGIIIHWDCNLDYSLDNCRPMYTFRRLDNRNALIAPGYNFRYSINYKENDTEFRTQTKAYGILFQVIVSGEAGKFDVVPLILNIASGLALLSLASIMADICVLYLLKKRYFYRQKKYQLVDDIPYEDADADTDTETQ
nr:P2X purinoceptor 4-like [Lytechinus pictus]XP_054749126.1 P2X purinoceptor 4-like [Lytechinus pictus]